MKVRHIVNSAVWWVAGAMFVYGFIIFSPVVVNDPSVTWAGRILLWAVILPTWPVFLGAIVVGLVLP